MVRNCPAMPDPMQRRGRRSGRLAAATTRESRLLRPPAHKWEEQPLLGFSTSLGNKNSCLFINVEKWLHIRLQWFSQLDEIHQQKDARAPRKSYLPKTFASYLYTVEGDRLQFGALFCLQLFCFEISVNFALFWYTYWNFVKKKFLGHISTSLKTS